MGSDFNTSVVIRPIEGGFVITPSDTINNDETRGVYVGVGGNLRVLLADGSDITFDNLLAGIIHPIRCIRVFLTDTSAASIIGLV